MKRYFSIYLRFIKLNVATLVAYRGNFINNFIGSFVWAVFSFVQMFLQTSRTPTIYGWKQTELMLLVAGYAIVIGIFHMIFTRNFERFWELINYGYLDSILLKPVDSQFFISTRFMTITSSIRILMGIGVGFYYLHLLHISLTILGALEIFLFTAVGILLLYSLWFIVLTLTIWFSRLSNIVDLMYTVSGLVRYPRDMYAQLGSYVFLFLLPVILIVTTPVGLLLRTASWKDGILLFVLALSFFASSRLFWRFALRYYTSASN